MQDRIHISATTAALLDHTNYVLEPRETPIEVKGKGTMYTHWLNGVTQQNVATRLDEHIARARDLLSMCSLTEVGMFEKIIERRGSKNTATEDTCVYSTI